MIKRRQNNKKKLTCPHCGQTFQRAQALGGHIRYKHTEALASKHAAPKERKKAERPVAVPDPNLETNREAESVLESVAVVAAVASLALPASVVSTESVAPNGGPHQYLNTALAELIERQRQIDEDLARLQALQVEKEVVGKQVNAVNLALQAFRE
jgi:hypothetical protein